MRHATSFILTFCSVVTCLAFAQDAPTATATCNFDEEKQLVAEYRQVPVKVKKPLSDQVPFGKVWAPGGKPITLFTNTPVEIGSQKLPIGAYTMFLIPESKQWTLIVSKSTEMSGTYNEKDDVARVPMESGELPSPESSLNISFGHIAKDQCAIRVSVERQGHFTTFQAKE